MFDERYPEDPDGRDAIMREEENELDHYHDQIRKVEEQIMFLTDYHDNAEFPTLYENPTISGEEMSELIRKETESRKADIRQTIKEFHLKDRIRELHRFVDEEKKQL